MKIKHIFSTDDREIVIVAFPASRVDIIDQIPGFIHAWKYDDECPNPSEWGKLEIEGTKKMIRFFALPY